jgi:hypothetical protein
MPEVTCAPTVKEDEQCPHAGGRSGFSAAMQREVKQNKWRDESCAVDPMPQRRDSGPPMNDSDAHAWSLQREWVQLNSAVKSWSLTGRAKCTKPHVTSVRRPRQKPHISRCWAQFLAVGLASGKRVGTGNLPRHVPHCAHPASLLDLTVSYNTVRRVN